jgi:hypothetical protein
VRDAPRRVHPAFDRSWPITRNVRIVNRPPRVDEFMTARGSLAFVALIGLLLFLGMGFVTANLAVNPPVPPSANLLWVPGIFAWIAAAPLWYTAARIVLTIGKSPADHTITPPAPAELSSPVTSN